MVLGGLTGLVWREKLRMEPCDLLYPVVYRDVSIYLLNPPIRVEIALSKYRNCKEHVDGQ